MATKTITFAPSHLYALQRALELRIRECMEVLESEVVYEPGVLYWTDQLDVARQALDLIDAD